MQHDFTKEYDNSPLIEVVCGVVFKPLIKLTAPYYGIFWKKIYDDFPKYEQAAPVHPFSENPTTRWLEPKNLFVNTEEGNVIQLENNKFFINWRKTDSAYPRFQKVKEKFLYYKGLFDDFLKEYNLGEIRPTEYRLIYVNHIEKGQGWQDFRDIGNVFTDFLWRKDEARYLTDIPVGFNLQIGMEALDKIGTLSIKLQTVERKHDLDPVFSLELLLQGFREDLPMEDWFNLAHKHVLLSFEDLTNDQIKNEYWMKK